MVFPVLRMNAKIMSFHWKVFQITSIKKREKKVPLDGKVAVGRELGEQDVDDALLLPTLYEVMIVVNPKHVALVMILVSLDIGHPLILAAPDIGLS